MRMYIKLVKKERMYNKIISSKILLLKWCILRFHSIKYNTFEIYLRFQKNMCVICNVYMD